MGLVGLLVTVLVMILGAGYFLFQSPGASFTVENPIVMEQGIRNKEQQTVNREQGVGNREQGATENRLSVGMEALEAAKEIKEMAEERAEETMEPTDDRRLTIDDELSSAKAMDGQAGNNQDPNSSFVNPQSAIKNNLVSFGHEKSSGRSIDTIILHSSYNNQGGDKYSVEKVINIWKSYDVAPHYLIDRRGNIYRLVEDENIAYHAGVAKLPDGRTGVNGVSIGIEILNSEEDAYTDAQYEAINDLIVSLKGKYKIKYVLGHNDIAPGRKTDPWNFDWKKLK